jgi:transposase-like protein
LDGDLVDVDLAPALPPHPCCPDCDVAMWLVRIGPKVDGAQQHYYECKACGGHLVLPAAT